MRVGIFFKTLNVFLPLPNSFTPRVLTYFSVSQERTIFLTNIFLKLVSTQRRVEYTLIFQSVSH